jgi:hypothetical protein
MGASAILKLQAAGFSREQVEALADFMDTQAASKADLIEVEHRLEVKISDVRTEVIRWVVGMGFAQVGLILAVLRFVPH